MDDGDEPIHRPLPAAVTALPAARTVADRYGIAERQAELAQVRQAAAEITKTSAIPSESCRIAASPKWSALCHWTKSLPR
jgi:hypothetical protein